ncbi:MULTISPECIES: hypothetical protein [unclassified Halobacterium]|uniref:hypothetical protein n=1 Tax=unclassified Halobacterium TaxID=2668073 RepID=UPI001962E93A|nr:MULTISPECIES: hypothetical protein [unclassified Halobacterium]QRY22477.1 hypothetical protein JT689_10745 [Halobacterium sp. GSL-19]QRY24557.1 hypothetical protein JRZ79_09120 [Halobacterium sp. BOL4-2]
MAVHREVAEREPPDAGVVGVQQHPDHDEQHGGHVENGVEAVALIEHAGGRGSEQRGRETYSA